MTNEDKNKILELRNKGYDYKSIANQLNQQKIIRIVVKTVVQN